MSAVFFQHQKMNKSGTMFSFPLFRVPYVPISEQIQIQFYLCFSVVPIKHVRKNHKHVRKNHVFCLHLERRFGFPKKSRLINDKTITKSSKCSRSFQNKFRCVIRAKITRTKIVCFQKTIHGKVENY